MEPDKPTIQGMVYTDDGKKGFSTVFNDLWFVRLIMSRSSHSVKDLQP